MIALEYDGLFPCYPHDYKKFILVVPYIHKIQSTFWQSILNFPLINVWAIAILIFYICRKFIHFVLPSKRNAPHNGTLINTYGMSFGVTAAPANISNSTEKLLLLFLSIFALVASNLCSSILFSQFSTSSEEPAIQTFQDLGKFKTIDLMVPVLFTTEMHSWLREQYNIFRIIYFSLFFFLFLH